MSKNPKYYAVAKGRNPGIYTNWDDCRAQVHRYPGERYKSFSTQSEAENYIRNSSSETSQSSHYGQSYSSGNSYSGGGGGGGGYSGSYKPQADNRYYEPESQPRTLDDFIPLGITKATTLRTLPKQSYELTSSRTYSSGGGYRSNKGRGDLVAENDGFVDVYTDGACSSNGYENAQAGIGVWFGHNHSLNVSRPASGPATNNRAEIEAATEAIKQAKKAGIDKLRINTDSKFLIDCATEWIPQWKNNNWKKSNNQPVINKNELLAMEREMKSMREVEWRHVNGHAGIEGNEMADKLAKAGSLQYNNE